MEHVMQTESQLQDQLIKLKEAAITSDQGVPPPPPPPPTTTAAAKEEILDATKRRMQETSDGITQQQRAEFDRIRKSAVINNSDNDEKKSNTNSKDDSNDDIPSISTSVKSAIDVLLPGSSKRPSVIATSPTSQRIVGDTPSDSEDSIDLDTLLGKNVTKTRSKTNSDPPSWSNKSNEDLAAAAKISIDFLSNNKKSNNKANKESSIFDED